MTSDAKNPTGTHNPSQKSLQRWDAEGGAPKGGRTKRPRDPAQLAKPTIDFKAASAVKRLYEELVVAVNKANAFLRASGMTSQKFLEADRSVGKIVRQIKQIHGTPDERGIQRPTSKATARKASQLAAREIEGLRDKSQPAAEQQRRKRRLIRGPREFRDIREDQTKGKS